MPDRFMKPSLTLPLVVLLALAGCASPPYQRPEAVVPAAFKEGQGWKLANPQAAEVPSDWWRLFNDPVLDELQQRLAAGNQNLRASLAQYRTAQAALASSRSSLFPSLGLSAGATRAESTPGARPTTSYNLGASASWELDLWGRVSSGVDAAAARVEASQADLAAVRLSLQATLTQTYLSTRAAEAQAQLYERTVQAYQRSLELTRNRYLGGVASAADVAQAESQLKSTQAQAIEARSSRAQLEHALAVLVGEAPANFSLAPTGVLPQPPQAPLQLPSELLERRPDIAAAERRVAAANAQIGVARAAFFPSLTLSASAGFRGSSLGGLVASPNGVWSLGPALALSLLDGGARQAAVDSARAGVDQAVATYRQTVLTALQEVEDNLVIASSLDEEQRLQSEALAAARRALEIAENQYRAGTVSYLNVVTAQTTVLSAERSLLDARNRRLAALNQLLKNIAGRWDVPVPAPAAESK